MAWLTNWNKRKQLYLNGTTAGNQSYYQMKITINYGTGTDGPGNIFCGGNCRTDFGDIRFTDTDGTSLLYYWIDISNTTNGSKAIIWVNIPSITTGSNSAYIYVYYNNPSVTTIASGTNTFVFFDSFDNSADLSNYTISLYAGTGSGNISAIITSDYISPPSSMLMQMMVNGGLTNFWILANRVLSITSGTYEIDYWTKTVYGNQGTYATYPNYSYIQINGTSYNGQAGTGTYPSISWVYTGFTFTGSITTIGLYSTWRGFNGGPGAYYDDLRIRKYATPEPTWSSTISAEQASVTLNITSTPTGGEIWLATPAGSSWVDQLVQTNNTIYVAPGSYDVLIGLGGYQPWTLYNQNYISGQTYTITANLVPQPGSLAISSTPTGAEIYLAIQPSNPIDQNTVTILGGRTISNLTPGTYNIKLTLTGYQDWIGSTTVNSNTTITVSATFAGSVNIISTPSNSSIYLDGSPTSIGNTPKIITNLTAPTSGATMVHTYLLKLSGYSDISGSFNASAGQTINISALLLGTAIAFLSAGD